MNRYIRHHIADPDSPVMDDEDRGGPDAVEDGIALCLSGGGYRAMLFHLGAIWRLNELGHLRKLAQVSSVSGGAIIAGLLGHVWDRLVFDPNIGAASHETFVREIVEPIRCLAGTTLDLSAIAAGALLPTVTTSNRIEAAYDKHLFGGATLEQLPAERDRDGRRVAPCFLINATNVQTGALWRFSREYMGERSSGSALCWSPTAARHWKPCPRHRAPGCATAFVSRWS
jgi:NTE family protein